MGVGLRPIEKSVDLPPNPKVARAAFLSKLRGVRGNSHSYRDHKKYAKKILYYNISICYAYLTEAYGINPA